MMVFSYLFDTSDGRFKFNENDVWSLFQSASFYFSVWEIWGALLYGEISIGGASITADDLNRSELAATKLLAGNPSKKKLVPLLPYQYILTFTQTLYLMTNLFKPTLYINKEKLEAVCKQLVQRHEALRARFSKEGYDWQQIIYPYNENDTLLGYYDLTEIKEDAERAEKITVICDKLMRDMHYIEDCYAFRIALFESHGEQYLFIALDHNSFDLRSINILLNELKVAYSGQFLPPVILPYSEIISNVFSLMKDWHWQEERDFWLKQLDRVTCLPKTAKPPGNSSDFQTIEPDLRNLSFELTGEWIKLLINEVPRSTKLQLHEILLTAWIQTLCTWCNSPGIVISLLINNRNLLKEMDQTIGAFATHHPLYLELPLVPTTALETMFFIRSQLENVPHKGSRYGLFRCNEEVNYEILTRPQPQVLFNFLGREKENQKLWGITSEDLRKGHFYVSYKNHQVQPFGENSTGFVSFATKIKLESITFSCNYLSAHNDENSISDLLHRFRDNLQVSTYQLLDMDFHVNADLFQKKISFFVEEPAKTLISDLEGTMISS